MIKSVEEILARMTRQCSLREYCQWDIRQKLRKLDLPEDKAEEVISILIRDGYLSDERYTRAYMSDKSTLSGWGKEKIFFHLRGKYISYEVLERIWEEFEQDSRRLDKMRSVIANKWNSLSKEEPQKRVEKTLRFAIGRGFCYNQSMAVIKDLKTGNM
ncbi:MAG: RecX family transcriptional regulator [Bacteroidales bacterium]|nr:RecX family transcriptional regulator [Bacteroidales bacterium]